MSLLSERLRWARDKKNLSQTEAANRIGISNKTLSGYENGVSSPDYETLSKLANLYGVTTDHLINVEVHRDSLNTHLIKESRGTAYENKTSSRDHTDLKKLLEESEVMFDGVPLTEEDKQRVEDILTGLFWEAKQMNKRKKPDDNNQG